MVVDGVGGDREDGALREVVALEGDAWPGRNDAGKTEGGGGVNAEGFFYDVVDAVLV